MILNLIKRKIVYRLVCRYDSIFKIVIQICWFEGVM